LITCRIEFAYFPAFVSSLRRYARQIPNLKKDLTEIFQRIETKGLLTREAIGKGVYKVRVPLQDRHSGARGGGRLLLLRHQKIVIPFLFYLKSEYEDAPEELFRRRLEELRDQIAQQPPLPIPDQPRFQP